ncbi:hypothetical protein BDZ94DRAFT_1322002 [Collybia nuda]|uniref:SAP domain-containing protein n=1 Tax=Collybia nuda TaxID=64659 RepID=A0A9P6CJW7_9AGAR|nr:hypothetical protein BDZ94DRAFT_1322002 [Collybia nuda]
MSTTTQILFNSPALHALKRDQLVKLCKIHSIKATGKNVELIEKLKQHAQTLPRDSPLSVATRSEGTSPTDVEKRDETVDEESATEDNNPNRNFQLPRPSEQWEVVMESIEEAMEDSSSQGTLSSMRTLSNMNGVSGEFGTGTSKSSSVSSSIKALASSLGLKRHKAALISFPTSSSSKSTLYNTTISDDLIQNSTPYSALPPTLMLPQTDHFTFDPPAANPKEPSALNPPNPLPGHSLRPGVPAPDNARLSLGLGLGAPTTPTRLHQPTTTIRLISNPQTSDIDRKDYIGRTPQLKPFKTSFDLVMSPTSSGPGLGFGGSSLWPRGDDTEEKGLYPPLPFDTFEAPAIIPNSMDTDEPMPGTLSPCPPHTPAPVKQLGVPTPKVEPFIFGSPLPQHNVTNTQFKSAAASVLEEMNKRLKEEGVEGVGMDLINKLQPGAHTNGVGTLMNRDVKPLPKTNGIKEKFEKMHQNEFDKMEGIDGLVKRRNMSPKKDSDEGRESIIALGKKRKSSILGHGAGRDRYGRRIGGDAIAGRISATRVISTGRRPRVLPGSFGDDDGEDSENEGGDHYEELNDTESRVDKKARLEPPSAQESEKEKEAEKRIEDERKRKEREKEAIRRKLEMNKAKRRSSAGIATRGRVSVGRGGILQKPKPSKFGFLSSAKTLVQNVWNRGKVTAAPVPAKPGTTGIPKPIAKVEKVVPPAPLPAAKRGPLVSFARPSTATASGNRVSSLHVKEVDKTTVSTMSSRARSPLPSFGTASSTKGSFMSGTRVSRVSSIAGTGTSSKAGASSAVSSIGTRSSFSIATKPSSLGVGSLGVRKLSVMPNKPPNAGSSSSRLSSRLSSSRLLAPTASSLAKTTRPSSSGLKSVVEKNHSKVDTLNMITNSPGMGNGPWSPRPGGIFSRPIEMPSGIPTPVKKRSLQPPSDSARQTDDPLPGEVKDVAPTLNPPAARQRSLNGRKPRISRSKVIAKLASQRAGGTTTGKIGGTPHTSRTRSSLGAKAQRSSFGGKSIGGMRGGASSDVMMSAKKRARQSEFARRRSKVGPLKLGNDSDAMEVDAF